MPSTKSKRSTASREWRVSVIKKKLEYVGTVVAADKANAEAQAVAEFELSDHLRRRQILDERH